MKNQFKIYRLCRDQQRIDQYRTEGKKYDLPDQVLTTGPDYFTFIENILKTCKEDYALLCHDDVVVPLDIADRVDECISKADDFCGPENWGVVGNAGVEAISLRTVRFLKDPHAAVVPYRSRPIPVVSVDGNTMLLNIKNMRKKNVSIPKGIRGFHLYDFITLVECYRKNLLTLVDSTLYVYHRSGGTQGGFDKFTTGKTFQKYWRKNFINHRIFTINGPIEIEDPDLSYLKENSGDKRTDFYGLVKEQLLTIKREVKPTVNLITRTQLHNREALLRLIESVQIACRANKESLGFRLLISVNNIQGQIPDLFFERIREDYSDFEIVYIEENVSKNLKPRVKSIEEALKAVPERDDQYVWVVDDDDFIFPKELALLTKYLDSETIFIGKSEPFGEVWESGNSFPISSVAKPGFYSEVDFARNYLGDNRVPICSVIFPQKLLRKVFQDNKLYGDYYEDYALIFLAQSHCNVQYLPLLIAGISHHDNQTIFENDRTHWDYSYTTFLSEMTNSGAVNNSTFELNSTLDNYIRNYRSSKFLVGLAWGKIKTILLLLFRLKLRALYNTLKNFL